MNTPLYVILLYISFAFCTLITAILLYEQKMTRLTFNLLFLTAFIGIITLTGVHDFIVNWNLILKYLKVLLSAPPLATIAFLIFIFIFQNDISSFISRIKRIHGVDLADHQTPIEDSFHTSSGDSTRSKKPEPAYLRPEGFDASLHGTATVIDESKIPDSLKNDHIAISQIKEAIENPYEYVAQHKKISIALNYERIFMKIFGTQIKLLEQLAGKNKPLTTHEISAFYGEFLSLGGQPTYPLSLYIDFLRESGLIADHGSTANLYRITQYGREFLSYIADQYPSTWFSKLH